MTSCLQNDELCTPNVLTSQGQVWLLWLLLQAGQGRGQGGRGAQGAKCKAASLSEGCRRTFGTCERGLFAFCALCASLAYPSRGPAAGVSLVSAGVQTQLNKSRARDAGRGSSVHGRQKQRLLEV